VGVGVGMCLRCVLKFLFKCWDAHLPRGLQTQRKTTKQWPIIVKTRKHKTKGIVDPSVGKNQHSWTYLLNGSILFIIRSAFSYFVKTQLLFICFMYAGNLILKLVIILHKKCILLMHTKSHVLLYFTFLFLNNFSSVPHLGSLCVLCI
jgi:hypothetical protein